MRFQFTYKCSFGALLPDYRRLPSETGLSVVKGHFPQAKARFFKGEGALQCIISRHCKWQRTKLNSGGHLWLDCFNSVMIL